MNLINSIYSGMVYHQTHCALFNFNQSAIRQVNISGNVDNPEGTMDALMQIAVCGSVRMLLACQIHLESGKAIFCIVLYHIRQTCWAGFIEFSGFNLCLLLLAGNWLGGQAVCPKIGYCHYRC